MDRDLSVDKIIIRRPKNSKQRIEKLVEQKNEGALRKSVDGLWGECENGKK
jgi:hypothetical protein